MTSRLLPVDPGAWTSLGNLRKLRCWISPGMVLRKCRSPVEAVWSWTPGLPTLKLSQVQIKGCGEMLTEQKVKLSLGGNVFLRS